MSDNRNNSNEGFVSRWSRRKQQIAEEETQQQANSNDQTSAQTTEVIGEEAFDPEQLKAEKLEALNKLTDEDMPDIDTLNENSDFSGFMSTSVSEGLRRMALKKLFMGKSYNIRDGLDEYDGDYTKFEKMPTSMVTSDMKHMVQVEAKKKLEKEQEEARQRMLASGELDEDTDAYDDLDEFDEFADDAEPDDEIVLADTEEKYVDEYINVDGFDTTVAVQDENNSDNNNINENEEIA